jgi:hypothetical protein
MSKDNNEAEADLKAGGGLHIIQPTELMSDACCGTIETLSWFASGR